ncbi:HAD family hydrolase [Thermogladius sp. 4427co]|uniref:HAD family hydrolase n=1 Tax=Thermogladius sp. 4427co TaxID=3450718 RepID=UPI003F793A39
MLRGFSEMIRVIILDYDLTIVDSLLDFYEAFQEALKNSGVNRFIPFNEFYRFFEEDRLNELLDESVDKDVFWKTFRRLYNSRYTRPYKYTYDFLKLAKSIGIKIVVATGRDTPSYTIWWDLTRFGLDEYVSEVYSSQDIYSLGGLENYVFDKSWLIKMIVDRYGVEPCDTLYIGDYSSDFLSARNAGVRFLGVAYEEGRRRVLREKGARIVVRDLGEAMLIVFSNLILELPCNAHPGQ